MIKMTRETPNAFNQTEIMVDDKEVETYKKIGWKTDDEQDEKKNWKTNAHVNKKNEAAKENAEDKKDLF